MTGARSGDPDPGLFRALSEALSLLLGERDPKLSLPESLRIIGEAVGADQSFLVRLDAEGPGIVVLGFAPEGDPAPGGTPAFLPAFKDLLSDRTSAFFSRLAGGESFFGRTADQPDLVKSLFEPSGMEVLFLLPVQARGEFRGFVGFTCRTAKREWSRDDRSAIISYAAAIGSAVERSEAETELGKAREAAEAEALAKGSFVANVSHEIRTPLNAILGFSELISERSSDPQTQDYLRAIKTAGGSLLSLVNNLLDLGRMEAKNFELHPEPMELGRLLDELGAVFGIRLKEKGLAFELAKGPGLPGALLLDSARLRQILYNLIGNAVKYTERGSVKVEARAGPAKAGKVGLSVSVRDTGIGVSEEAAKALSSDFSHLSGGSMYKSGGLGLGLTISRRLATLMGGHLEFETSIGKGSTFTLVLPEVEVAEAPWLPPVTGLAARRFLPADILLVEDARFNRMVVVDFLKNSGLTVHEAENGLQGLELTRSLGPSLILLDMKMPVMDGAEMLEHLRADPLTRDIPVIAMTAGSIEADEDPGQVRVACDAYLGKPHTRAELLLVLERFLPSEERKALDLPPAGSEPPEALTIGRFFPGARLGALMTEWRKVAELSSIDDIELFAKRILREASRGGDAAAVSWAESLIEACSSFDLLLMERLFGDFPRLAGASDEGLG